MKQSFIYRFFILLFSNFLLISNVIAKEQISEERKPIIVATTSIIADAITNIVQDHAEVQSIMGPGIDPHLYKSTPQDLRKMRLADIIFFNGLFLEGKLSNLLENFKKQKPVYAMSDGIDPAKIIYEEVFGKVPDPHVWLDVKLFIQCIAYISRVLQKTYPKQAKIYRRNTKAYIAKLLKLDQKIRYQIQMIPKRNRILITSHDAFQYFAKAYEIEVKALQGISTVAECGLRDIVELSEFIIQNDIKAIFIEISIGDKPLKAVVEQCASKKYSVKIGDPLYTDALGDKSSPAGTYIEMVEHNVNCMVKALKEK